MSLTKRVGLVTACAISLVLLGMFALAQVRPIDGIGLPLLNAPTVIAGSDLGFRVESERAGIPVGKLVVRVNGKWVEAQLDTGGVVPAGGR